MDHYERLRVTRDATRAQIRAAYLRLVALHHPDRSVAPDAAEVTAELNEAYSVLEDERKRREYDDALRAAAVSAQKAAARAREEPRRRAEIPQIRCETCGAVDSSLRAAEFLRCVSFVKNFSRARDAGIRCQPCRSRAAVKANLISGIFGWWSPGGLFYAPHALWVNTRGGSQDKPRNAVLLRTLGHQLFALGDVVESVRALRASLALAADERTSKLLEYAAANAGGPVADPRRRSFSPFLAAVIAPVLFSACGVWVARHPLARASANTGAAQEPAPATAAAAAEHEEEVTPPAPSDPYVARLATLVEVRSPIIGTHSEAGAIVREHEIDRSRFDAREIDQIADAIARQLGPGDQVDPRVVAAYFNARILALSIHLINAMRAGEPVDDQAADVQRFLRSEPVATWLRSGAYRQAAADLQNELRAVTKDYAKGAPLSALEEDLSVRKQALSQEELRLEFYRRANVTDYKARVDDFNRGVRAAKAAMREYRRRRSGLARLEVAFNRCLDPKILFTRFGRVEITRNASGFEEAGEDADTR
ncbi:MAG TPA: J domain-containing protein [Myxococcales bacterium]|nr:J domain-containing protein [Myxococcales bacterium]